MSRWADAYPEGIVREFHVVVPEPPPIAKCPPLVLIAGAAAEPFMLTKPAFELSESDHKTMLSFLFDAWNPAPESTNMLREALRVNVRSLPSAGETIEETVMFPVESLVVVVAADASRNTDLLWISVTNAETLITDGAAESANQIPE
jgi:hypothetical protein